MNKPQLRPAMDCWYKDWMFWLLLLVINMSGNLSFTYIFPYKPVLILLFILLAGYSIKRYGFPYKATLFILIWGTILSIQGIYSSDYYSISSSFHIFIKIVIGVLTLLILKEKFISYYSNIIYIFSIISLFCFAYNTFVGILPFISVETTEMDDGNIFRVSSIIYTQLYNLNTGYITLRNCGPFWEPGAFQGFVNLAITLEVLTTNNYTKYWYRKMIILLLTVITTFSTGGFVVLFFNILFFLHITNHLTINSKVIISISVLIVFISIFISTDFLGEKIFSDKGRLDISFNDLGEGLYLLFGYGYGAESITQSSIKSASSIFNLIRYTGIIGLIIFFYPILGLKFNRIYFGFIIFLILMNEPFLTAGPFWWSIPLLWELIKKRRDIYNECTEKESNRRMAQVFIQKTSSNPQ